MPYSFDRGVNEGPMVSSQRPWNQLRISFSVSFTASGDEEASRERLNTHTHTHTHTHTPVTGPDRVTIISIQIYSIYLLSVAVPTAPNDSAALFSHGINDEDEDSNCVHRTNVSALFFPFTIPLSPSIFSARPLCIATRLCSRLVSQ